MTTVDLSRVADDLAAGPTLHEPKGIVHDVWVIARRGLIHMKRQPEQLSDATIQPIMFVLMFGYVFGGAIAAPGGGSYREFLMGGIIAQTLTFTTFGVALSIANDRKNQVVDRFRSVPIAGGAVLGGHALANLIKAFLPVVLMSVTGLIIGWRIRGGFVQAVEAYLLMMGFVLAMIWVGILLGSLVQDTRGRERHRVRGAVPAHVRGQHLRPAGLDAERPAHLRRAGTRSPRCPTACVTCSATRSPRPPRARRGPRSTRSATPRSGSR